MSKDRAQRRARLAAHAGLRAADIHHFPFQHASAIPHCRHGRDPPLRAMVEDLGNAPIDVRLPRGGVLRHWPGGAGGGHTRQDGGFEASEP